MKVNKMIDLNLSAILIPSKTTEVEFPGYPNFKLSLCFLSRDELVKIRKKATKTKFDRKTRQPIDEVDDDLFLRLYVDAIVKGWSGFKLKYLTQLMPIDATGFKDLEDELAFTADNAFALMKNSPDFDSFVSDTTGDLQNFTKASSK